MTHLTVPPVVANLDCRQTSLDFFSSPEVLNFALRQQVSAKLSRNRFLPFPKMAKCVSMADFYPKLICNVLQAPLVRLL